MAENQNEDNDKIVSNDNSSDAPWMSVKSTIPVFENTLDFHHDYNLIQLQNELDDEGQLGDYSDLEAIHMQIKAARLNLYEMVVEQDKVEAALLEASEKYARARGRIYLDSAGTEKVKSTIADIKTESLHNTVLTLQCRLNLLIRHSNFVRGDLKTLEVLANDYRQMARIQ